MRKAKWILAAGCVGFATVSTSLAVAQERTSGSPSYFGESVRAPLDAFELGVFAGYSQGTMSPAAGLGAADLSKAGGSFHLQAGYRFTPEFGLHLFGQYDEFTPGDRLTQSGSARGGAAGINGTLHVLPFDRIDPWVRLGVGYRMLWTNGDPNAPDAVWHGFQLAKLDIGADLRTDKNVAIGPTIGVDLTEFVWRNPTGDAGNEEISGKRVVPFLYAGLQGRFDIGGARQGRSGAIADSR